MQTKRITNVPGLAYLWQVDNLYLAGQPTKESIKAMYDRGVRKIYNLRAADECDQSEIMAMAKELGMEYEQFPIIVEGQLDAENCERLSKQMNETDPQFIHCGSANRVAGWLMVYLTKYRGMDFDEAVDIASENGLSNPGFIGQAEDLIED